MSIIRHITSTAKSLVRNVVLAAVMVSLGLAQPNAPTDIQAFYVGAGGLLFELYSQCGSTGWCWGNVSGTSSNYAPPADPGSPLSSSLSTTRDVATRLLFRFRRVVVIRALQSNVGPTDWCCGAMFREPVPTMLHRPTREVR